MGRYIIPSKWQRARAMQPTRVAVGSQVGGTPPAGPWDLMKGFGTETTGGEGGRSYVVTNLNDDGDGSLRDGLRYEDGPQVITIHPSIAGGLIWNQSPLYMKHPNVDLLASGITLKGEELRIRSHDIRVRDLHDRTGDVLPCEDGFDDRDCMNVGNASTYGQVYNVCFFHCSFSWSVDEALTCDGSHDLTIQNCIISEPLYNSLHPKGPHSMSLLFRSSSGAAPCYNVSCHGNLIANGNERNPQIAVATFIDFRNNVVYNWGNEPLAIEAAGSKRINVVANYYKPGPNQGSFTSWFRVANSVTGDTQVYIAGNTGPLDGNFITDPNFDNWNFIRLDSGLTPTPTGHRLDAPFEAPAINELSAAQAYDFVLANAGAVLVNGGRDYHDTRIVAQVTNNTGAIINSETDVGGWI